MQPTKALEVPGSTVLDTRQQYRLETANLVLKKLAELQLRNYRHADQVARISYHDGFFVFHPADPRQQLVRMDDSVEGEARVWKGFAFTRPDMVLLRSLAAFVLDGRKISGWRLVHAVMINFGVEELAPVRFRYDAVISAFRFANVFAQTDLTKKDAAAR